MSFDLFQHQQYCRELASRHDSYGYFLDTGTGKTRLGLAIAHDAYQNDRSRTLVLTKLSIMDGWLIEAEKMGLDLAVVKAWSKSPAERKWIISNGDYDVLVMNYESARIEVELLLEQEFGVLLCDESSVLKSPTTRVSKFVEKLCGVSSKRSTPLIGIRGSLGSARRSGPASRSSSTSTRGVSPTIPRVYMLSGSPAPNGQHEYWTQTHCIGGIWDEQSHYQWRNRWFYRPVAHLQWLWRPVPSLETDFKDRLRRRCIYIHKEDCADLPEQMFIEREVEMTAAERRAYFSIEKDWIYRHKGQVTLASNELVERMKLRQVTGGWTIPSGQNSNPELLSDGEPSKLDALMEIIDEIGPEQLIVVVQFRHEAFDIQERIQDETDLRPGLIIGGMNERDRASNIAQFTSGDLRYLIVHPQAGGMGLNLQSASNMVWYSLTYSPEQWQQMNDRIWRTGQINRCTYFLLLSRGGGNKTVDHEIYDAVTGKQDLATALLEKLKK